MRHTFEIDGIYINPKLPYAFDITPHEERDDEMNDWWYKPYIIIDELQQESWIEHYCRLKQDYNWSDEEIGSEEDYLKELERQRKLWFKKWHTGFRYEVRCLDGGAWDRSTNHGMFATFEESLNVAKQLKD